MRRVLEYDLSADNELYRLPSSMGLGCVLAGGFLIEEFASNETEELLLDSLLLQVHGKFSAVRHWLMVGHNTWQPNTRIVRYHRLWKAFSKVLDLPQGHRSEEFLVECDQGLRYFGFIECTCLEAGQLWEILRTEATCTLLATWGYDPTEELRSVAQQGWSQSMMYPPAEILRMACGRNLLIYCTIGKFDDRNRGSGVIGESRWIGALFDKSQFSGI